MRGDLEDKESRSGNMFQVFCPRCGHMAVAETDGRVATCARCKEKYPVPKGYSRLESSFVHAMDARLRRDFTAAQTIYSEILKQYPNSAAALWGRAISRYGVEYQKLSEQQYRLVCHQATLADFTGDADVVKALQLAQPEEIGYYTAESQRIGQLQKKVAAYAALTEPVDVVLVVDANHAGSMAAAKAIRTGISAAGLRCVCPAMDLQQTPRQDWEPALYHGLQTASAMVYVAVGADAFGEEALFDAGRFLSRKAASHTSAAGQVQQAVVAFARLSEYDDIPDALFDGADRRMSITGQDFMTQLCELLQQARADYAGALRVESGSNENYAYTNLIRQARLSLEAGNFRSAQDAYNEILNFNPRESQAYWGLLLAQNRCPTEDALIKKGALIREDSNYRSAVAFANEREAQTYRQVAQEAEQSDQLHRTQAAEEKRLQEEAEAYRAMQEEQLALDKERQRAKQARANIFRVVIALVALVAAVFIGLHIYKSGEEGRAMEAQYKLAMEHYNSGEYNQAIIEFKVLGDYKDSLQMIETCEAENDRRRFYEGERLGADLKTRSQAVAIMESLAEERPDAQEYLDKWLREAQDYYNAGEYRNAYLAVRGYEDIPGEGYRLFRDVWRRYMSQGIISAADNGSVLAIQDGSGRLRIRDVDHLDIRDESYQSVSLSNSGKSAGLVLTDGTAYLAGEVAGLYDISGWTGMRSIQVSDDQVVGLQADGTLICAGNGVLATDVLQFHANSGHVAAVRKDGTIFCTDTVLQEALAQTNDAVYVALSYRAFTSTDVRTTLYIVNEKNEMQLIYNDWMLGVAKGDTDLPTGGVLAVIIDSGAVAVLRTDGNVYSSRTKNPSKTEYTDAFLVDLSDAMDVRIRSDMTGYGLNGSDELQIEMRKFINDLENIGLPE